MHRLMKANEILQVPHWQKKTPRTVQYCLDELAKEAPTPTKELSRSLAGGEVDGVKIHQKMVTMASLAITLDMSFFSK